MAGLPGLEIPQDARLRSLFYRLASVCVKKSSPLVVVIGAGGARLDDIMRKMYSKVCGGANVDSQFMESEPAEQNFSTPR